MDIFIPRREFVHPRDRRAFLKWLGAGFAASLVYNPLFGARSFDGNTANYLNNASALAGPQNFSVAGWVNFNSVAGNQTLFSLNSATDRQNLVQTVTTALWAASYDGATSNAAISLETLTTSTWIHWAAVFASTTSRSIFKDNVKVTNTTSINPTGMDRTSLGSYNGSVATNPLNGLLAHVGLWSTTLGDDEIASLSKGITPQKIRMAALVNYWPLVTGDGNDPGVTGALMTEAGTVANSNDSPRIYR